MSEIQSLQHVAGESSKRIQLLQDAKTEVEELLLTAGAEIEKQKGMLANLRLTIKASSEASAASMQTLEKERDELLEHVANLEQQLEAFKEEFSFQKAAAEHEQATHKAEVENLTAESKASLLSSVTSLHALEAERDELAAQNEELGSQIDIFMQTMTSSKELQDTLVKQLHDQQARFDAKLENEKHAQADASAQRANAEMEHHKLVGERDAIKHELEMLRVEHMPLVVAEQVIRKEHSMMTKQQATWETEKAELVECKAILHATTASLETASASLEVTTAERDELAAQNEELDSQIDICMQTMTSNKDLQDTLVKQLHDQQARFDGERSVAEDRFAEERDALKHELATQHDQMVYQLAAHQAELENQLQAQKAQADAQLEKQKGELSRLRSTIKASSEASAASMQTLEKERDELLEHVANLEQQLEAFKEEFSFQKAAAEHERAAREAEVEKLSDDKSAALQSELEKLQQAAKDQGDGLVQSEHDLHVAEAERDELAAQIIELETQLSLFIQTLGANKELQDTLVKQLHDQQARFESDRSDIEARFEKDRDSMKAESSRLLAEANNQQTDAADVASHEKETAVNQAVTQACTELAAQHEAALKEQHELTASLKLERDAVMREFDTLQTEHLPLVVAEAAIRKDYHTLNSEQSKWHAEKAQLEESIRQLRSEQRAAAAQLAASMSEEEQEQLHASVGEQIQQQHELLERERSIMKQTIDSLQEELSSQMHKGRSDFESNIASMKQQQEAWDQQLVVLTRQRDERADHEDKLEKELQSMQERLNDSELQCAAQEVNVTKLQMEYETAYNKCKQVEADKDEFQIHGEECESQIELLMNALKDDKVLQESLTKQIHDLEAYYKTKVNSLQDTLDSKQSDEATELETIANKLQNEHNTEREEFEQEASDLNDQIRELQKEQAQSGMTVQHLEGKLEAAEIAEAVLTTELEISRAELEQLQEKYKCPKPVPMNPKAAAGFKVHSAEEAAAAAKTAGAESLLQEQNTELEAKQSQVKKHLAEFKQLEANWEQQLIALTLERDEAVAGLNKCQQQLEAAQQELLKAEKDTTLRSQLETEAAHHMSIVEAERDELAVQKDELEDQISLFMAALKDDKLLHETLVKQVCEMQERYDGELSSLQEGIASKDEQLLEKQSAEAEQLETERAEERTHLEEQLESCHTEISSLKHERDETAMKAVQLEGKQDLSGLSEAALRRELTELRRSQSDWHSKKAAMEENKFLGLREEIEKMDRTLNADKLEQQNLMRQGEEQKSLFDAERHGMQEIIASLRTELEDQFAKRDATCPSNCAARNIASSRSCFTMFNFSASTFVWLLASCCCFRASSASVSLCLSLPNNCCCSLMYLKTATLRLTTC